MTDELIGQLDHQGLVAEVKRMRDQRLSDRLMKESPCCHCGGDLKEVQPSKWQCPNCLVKFFNQ